MSNQDGGWLFKCCPNEEPCPCIQETLPHTSSGLCIDHCDRLETCAGSRVDEDVEADEDVETISCQECGLECVSVAQGKCFYCTTTRHVPVSKSHLDAWYQWAGDILDWDTTHPPAEDWQLFACCARLRVAIDDLRALREKHNDEG